MTEGLKLIKIHINMNDYRIQSKRISPLFRVKRVAGRPELKPIPVAVNIWT